MLQRKKVAGFLNHFPSLLLGTKCYKETAEEMARTEYATLRASHLKDRFALATEQSCEQPLPL